MAKKFKVFITRPIPEKGINMLKKHFQVKVRQADFPIPKKELEKEVKQCDALLCMLTDQIDSGIMDCNPKLKVISNFAVGYNNISIPAATNRRLPVGNTPNVLTQSTAEHAMSLIMSITKRVAEGDDIMRRNAFPGWGPMYMLGTELYNKTVGIIGCGRIGGQLARMMNKAFQCKILYTGHFHNEPIENATQAKKVSMNELLKKSDIVSIHVPLFPETTHLISTKEFGMMKKTAYLINTARGPIVDEKALLKALQKKQIAGAGLDVFEWEPKRLAGLEKCPNIVMTPHTASATWEARTLMSEVAAQNIIGILGKKQSPISIVNSEVLNQGKIYD
ncbi:MAG: D-glycerate dehydrogenase [Patescibacteria group bacterium]|jgi:glyoxylate reductase